MHIAIYKIFTYNIFAGRFTVCGRETLFISLRCEPGAFYLNMRRYLYDRARIVLCDR